MQITSEISIFFLFVLKPRCENNKLLSRVNRQLSHSPNAAAGGGLCLSDMHRHETFDRQDAVLVLLPCQFITDQDARLREVYVARLPIKYVLFRGAKESH